MLLHYFHVPPEEDRQEGLTHVPRDCFDIQ